MSLLFDLLGRANVNKRGTRPRESKVTVRRGPFGRSRLPLSTSAHFLNDRNSQNLFQCEVFETLRLRIGSVNLSKLRLLGDCGGLRRRDLADNFSADLASVVASGRERRLLLQKAIHFW